MVKWTDYTDCFLQQLEDLKANVLLVMLSNQSCSQAQAGRGESESFQVLNSSVKWQPVYGIQISNPSRLVLAVLAQTQNGNGRA